MNRTVKLLLAASAVIAVLGVFGYLTTGTVRGTEWSPDAVAHRDYEYAVFFGVPVGSKTMNAYKTSLEQELHSRGFVAQPHGGERWFIVDQKGPLGRTFSNRDLYAWDEEVAGEWIVWSQQSPDLARQFWGLIIDKARGSESSEVHRCLIDEAADVRQQSHISGIQNIVNPVCRVRS